MNADTPSGVESTHSFDNGFFGLTNDSDITDDNKQSDKKNDTDHNYSNNFSWHDITLLLSYRNIF